MAKECAVNERILNGTAQIVSHNYPRSCPVLRGIMLYQSSTLYTVISLCPVLRGFMRGFARFHGPRIIVIKPNRSLCQTKERSLWSNTYRHTNVFLVFYTVCDFTILVDRYDDRDPENTRPTLYFVQHTAEYKLYIRV